MSTSETELVRTLTPADSTTGYETDGQESCRTLVDSFSLEDGGETPESRYPYLDGFPLYNLIGALMLATTLVGLDMSVVATAVPTISNYFHSLRDANWYGSAYLISICAIQPLAGKIYTLITTKYAFIGFLAVFELGNLICALAQSSTLVIVGRAITGMGGSGLMGGVMVITTAASPTKLRPLLTACAVSTISVGFIVGPLIGGALTQHLGWRWCFWIFIPPGCLTIVIMLLLRIPEQTVKPPIHSTLLRLPQKLDLVGFALFSPTCILFLVAISLGGVTYSWNSPVVIGLLCGSVGFLLMFAAWLVYYGDDALIPPSSFRHRSLVFGCWITLFQGGATMMMGYYLPLWFQAVKAANQTNSGLMTLPSIVSQILGSVISGALVRKLHYIPPWAIVGSLLTTVGSGLMTTFKFSTPEDYWIGFQILIGFGRGMALNMPIVAAQEDLPGDIIAVACSMISFCQYLAGSFAISVAQSIFQNSLAPALRKYAPEVNLATILNSGATGYATLVEPDQLDAVRRAYNEALVKTFFLPTATAIAACLLSFGLPWKKIGATDRKK